MVFSSIPFLFFFLPLFLILYFAAKKEMRNRILLLFSLIFYAWGEPVCILLMLFISFSDYCIGRRLAKDRKKKWLVLSIIIDLCALGFFKYADFAVGTVNAVVSTVSGGRAEPFPLPGIPLPIGISFFTFQSMSYIFDLWKGEVEAEESYADYLTYISMFPQLIAGPIVRFQTIQKELHERVITADDISEGASRLACGIFKKILIANRVGKLHNEVCLALFGGGHTVSAAGALLGTAAFTLQLYFDFSAYSDMAIGIGRMLGFRYNENFRYPLSAVSITDFWRRWHISLSGWFRDYVYIPLGGSRRGVKRQILSMLAVWFLTGLWHGASWNFVIWGLWNFVFLLLEKYVWGKKLEKLPAVFRHFYMMAVTVTGFVFFFNETWRNIYLYLDTMFRNRCFFGEDFFWYLQNYGIMLAIAVILSFPVYPVWKEKVKDVPAVGVVSAVWNLGLFLLSAACLTADTYNPFLYFRF